MATDPSHLPASATVDLTGLPGPVVQGIKQLVESLRAGMQVDGLKATPERPPLRGRLSDLKLSIPKEDLDEAQRETWANFPREFPEPGKS